MRRDKWRDRIAIGVAIVAVALWAWWLFRPTPPTPFALRARWKISGFNFIDSIAISPRSDVLVAMVEMVEQMSARGLVLGFTVHFWRMPDGKEVRWDSAPATA